MPETIKDFEELEELSRLLDEMNSGHQPECSDKEIAQLLEVAELLHCAEVTVRPPQHILNQTVDRAMAGLQAGKSKRFKTWLYSGALGTAAAVFLVFGLSLLPSSTQQIPSSLPPAVNSDQQKSSQDIGPSIAYQPGPASEQVKVADSAKQEAPAAVPPQLASEAPLKPKVVAVAPPSKQPNPPAVTESAPFLAEQARTVNESKSAYKASSITPVTPKNLPPGLTVLSIPGRTPDEIRTDMASRVIRQVFNQGTPEEVVITQRAHVDITHSKSLTTASPTTEEKPGTLNKVTVTLYGQDITIEGRQSQQELLLLAESLTP